MGHNLKTFGGLAAACLLGVGLAAQAEAGRGYKHYDGDEGAYGYVTVHTTLPSKSVTAPVRPGEWGDEVKLPGGAWVTCEYSCEYTLRRHTVDFWDAVGPDKFVSPGYFRFEYDLDTGHAYHSPRY